jgi:hypothetical protein
MKVIMRRSSAINIYAGAYIKPTDHIIVKFGELNRCHTILIRMFLHKKKE